LLPLREIDFAPLVMYGEPDVDGAFPKSWLAIARDADDSIFAVLDAAKGEYSAYDPCTPADDCLQEFKECRLGKGVESLLDWILDQGQG